MNVKHSVTRAYRPACAVCGRPNATRTWYGQPVCIFDFTTLKNAPQTGVGMSIPAQYAKVEPNY